ncbi:phosphatase PAP2 family protein [Streptomyces sp. A7024]|uniref:Phosphatase PAP2 family protein n=1 Tax=Streptomyces coryli TaxID=1128680 RepID=A0A6G4TZS1_9ACTN|nr:phosphatase PAP2 family protein [Streptomyces coryli]NGN65010.1 phosphatase PAP2 family protein [Streptomyces coryli]
MTRRIAAWESLWARRALPAAEAAVEWSRLWFVVAASMSVWGGRRGRTAAAAGLTSLGVAQLATNTVGKKLTSRSRPPKEWNRGGGDRPDSSSFPSGHTAAAVAFTAGVAPTWPKAAAACAVPAGMAALARVHSGAHYPTDVAAGVAVGLSAAVLVRIGARRMKRQVRRDEQH